jgi:hypothetical protein
MVSMRRGRRVLVCLESMVVARLPHGRMRSTLPVGGIQYPSLGSGGDTVHDRGLELTALRAEMVASDAAAERAELRVA